MLSSTALRTRLHLHSLPPALLDFNYDMAAYERWNCCTVRKQLQELYYQLQDQEISDRKQTLTVNDDNGDSICTTYADAMDELRLMLFSGTTPG
jgi:hypothetical protein